MPRRSSSPAFNRNKTIIAKKSYHLSLLAFGTSILIGSTLLFTVQPLMGRLLLPVFGGVPAIWNTTLFFFQASLLLGYAYANFLTRLRHPLKQVGLHGFLLLFSLILLPLSVDYSAPPADTNPIPILLLRLTVAILLPFSLLASGSPLLQRWFSHTSHPDAKDPYFLYAISNVGSLGGLLAYLLIVEPFSDLSRQTFGWSLGYLLYTAFVGVAAVCFLRFHKTPVKSIIEPASTVTDTENNPSLKRRLHWIVLGFVPSSLLLGVTTHITTDVAGFPLLWVMPLALFLLTFILAFARKPCIPNTATLARMGALSITVLGFLLAAKLSDPIWLVSGVHLTAFFVIALAVHGVLANDRPHPLHLTQFYLLMSFGGVLGGAFNSIVAPLFFNGYYEYPITLAIAAWLLLPRGSAKKRLVWTAACLLPLALVIVLRFLEAPTDAQILAPATLVFAATSLLVHLFSRHRIAYATVWSLVLLVSTLHISTDQTILLLKRNFFGRHTVIFHQNEQRMELRHGNISHGSQFITEDLRRTPISYYHPSGPAGDFFRFVATTQNARIGIVGLGAGALAAYALPDQKWTFFEIDPLVIHIARDSGFFSYLQDSKAPFTIVKGDARMTLSSVTSGTFDLLVLDAYSSDAIPIHLLTREALSLYVERLAPGGILAFHLSNRHLDLPSVAAALFEDAELVSRFRDDTHTWKQEEQAGFSPSQWVLAARSEDELRAFSASAKWLQLTPERTVRPWTDSRASFLPLLRLGD